MTAPETSPSPVVHQAVVHTLATEISLKIAELRKLIVEPVDVVFSGDISFEIRPAEDDQRLSVFCAKRGCTTVNYTHEGVVLDIYPEAGLDPAHSACVFNEDLQDDGAEPEPS